MLKVKLELIPGAGGIEAHVAGSSKKQSKLFVKITLYCPMAEWQSHRRLQRLLFFYYQTLHRI